MKILTFGEIMMRLQTPSNERFMQAKSLDIHYGGGEANVAISLALLGEESYFCTKLPINAWGDACVKELKGLDVKTDFIVRGGSRMGLYFAEKGASVRPSKIIYDRANSAITEISLSDIDVEKMLQGIDWFHFSGITPALGDAPSEFLKKILLSAQKKGVTVSCDLNYRKNLWSKEDASKVMSSLLKYVDILISNEEDVNEILNIQCGDSNVDSGKLDVKGYENAAKQVVKKFGVKKMAFTLRESISASDNNWSGLISDGNETYVSKKYSLRIIDRIGGGDSFAAGLIYAIGKGYSDKESIEIAAAASAWKHTIEGDYNIIDLNELNKIKGGDGSGRVMR